MQSDARLGASGMWFLDEQKDEGSPSGRQRPPPDHLASNQGDYLGYAAGQVSFTLPEGDYRFRADKNGTQFWSGAENHCTLPGCLTSVVTTTIPMTVTVRNEGAAPQAGLRVYVFNEGTYTGFNGTTDAAGQVVFTLPQDDYRFRADSEGQQYWSAEGNHCEIPGCTGADITTPGGAVQIWPDTTTIDYTYDALNRLTDAAYTYPDGEGQALSYAYTYDAAGNRLTQETVVGEQSTTIGYQYDEADRLIEVSEPSSVTSYQWDANGNLLDDGERSFTYDSANRLTVVSGPSAAVSYQYAGDGTRLAQTIDGVTTQYATDLAAPLPQVLSENRAGTQTAYLYGQGMSAAYDSGNWAYQHPDALGSMRQQTDATGALILARGFAPFGEVLWQAGNPQGAFGFSGEQTDTETGQDPASGLIYLRSRYYDPTTGRFLTRDSYPAMAPVPQTLHRYAYVGNDPVNRTDPSGQSYLNDETRFSTDAYGIKHERTFNPAYFSEAASQYRVAVKQYEHQRQQHGEWLEENFSPSRDEIMRERDARSASSGVPAVLDYLEGTTTLPDGSQLGTIIVWDEPVGNCRAIDLDDGRVGYISANAQIDYLTIGANALFDGGDQRLRKLGDAYQLFESAEVEPHTRAITAARERGDWGTVFSEAFQAAGSGFAPIANSALVAQVTDTYGAFQDKAENFITDVGNMVKREFRQDARRILRETGLAPIVQSGPVADALRTGQRFLRSDAGQITYNLALTAGVVLGSGWTALGPAVAGALLGGGIDAVGQIISGRPFDWWQFGVAASRGALMGGIGGLIPGGGGGMARAALGELAGGRLQTLLYNIASGQDWGQDVLDPKDMTIDVISGAGGSAVRNWLDTRRARNARHALASQHTTNVNSRTLPATTLDAVQRADGSWYVPHGYDAGVPSSSRLLTAGDDYGELLARYGDAGDLLDPNVLRQIQTNPPRLEWDRISEQWRATADFRYNSKAYKAGQYAPISAALKPVDQVLPGSVVDANLNAFLEEVAGVKERLTIDDFFQMFPKAEFDTTGNAPSPQWVYDSGSGGEVRFKLQMPGYVERMNPEVQWRTTWKITPDWNKTEWAPYEHFFRDPNNPSNFANQQLRYGYKLPGQQYLNLAYGQAAQNQVAHLVSRTSFTEFVDASRTRLANTDALDSFERQLIAYKNEIGIP